jgi:hypothetical protein
MKALLARGLALATLLWLPGMSAWSAEVDVTSQITLAYTGYVLNRGTGTFDTQATLTNHQAALAAPVELVVSGLPAGVTLANASGKTASGTPFIDVGGTGIAQGGSASVILKFSDPLHATVSFKAQVLAGATGGVLTPTQRDAALTATELQWNKVVSSGADFVSGMLAYLKTRPELTNVMADGEGGVSARFLDGRLLSVQHNLNVAHGAAPAALPQRSLKLAAAAAGISTPGGKTAVLASGFTADYVNYVGLNDDIGSWLHDAGYTSVVSVPGATPQFLRANIKNVDVFLYTGHGGPTEDQNGNEDQFGVTTAVVKSTADPGTPQQFPVESADDTGDFAAGRLGYQINTVATDAKGNPVGGTFWAFTSLFVAKYMSFKPGSLVFMNACFSQGGHANAGFVASFLAHGAGTYLGWSGLTSDVEGMRPRYVFDRLLGEVPNSTRENVKQESPPQRAFDLAAVVQDLTAQALLPLADGSTLVTSGSNSILAPSIAALTVDEFNKRLLVTGIFDTSATALQDTVINVNDQPLCSSAQLVDSQTLACPIPVTGALSAGPVTLKAHGIKSNTVNLTSWQGSFVQEKDGGGSIKETAELFAHWRADIHPWRLKPHQAPQYFDRMYIVDTDSTLNWSVSGSQTIRATPHDMTLSVSGGGSIPLVALDHKTPPFFSMGIIISAETFNAWLLPTGVSLDGIHTAGTECTAASFGFTFLIDPQRLQSVGIWAPPPPETNNQLIQSTGVPVPLGSDYSLLTQVLPGAPTSGCPYSIGGDVTSKITVPAAKASFPPDLKAAQ